MVSHISIIIVDYNSHRDTLECLDSLAKVKVRGVELNVVVVDNGSLEPLKLRQAKKNVQLLRSDANLGFTGGNNIGIHHAIETFNSEYILLLNNDTTVKPDFLEHLLKMAKDDSSWGLISPKIYFYAGREFHQGSYSKQDRGRVIWYAGGSLDWQNLVAFHRGVDELDRGQFVDQESSDFATGCCVLIRRELLEKIGYLDKRYFLYFEDVDLSLRCTRAGYQIGYCDDSIIWHKNAASSGGAGSGTHQYYQERNRLLFSLLHGNLISRLRALKLTLVDLVFGTHWQRLAATHLLTGKFGKQPLA